MRRPLVTTLDDKYAVPFLVMFESMVRYGHIRNREIFVVHDSDSLSEHTRSKLNDFVASRNFKISFHTSNKYESFKNEFDSIYNRDSNDINKRWSGAVLLHGFIADAVPKQIDEIVFIETDLFFLRDANAFFDMPLNLPMAAQFDYGSGTQNHFSVSPYFNAGVFITSLEYWRNNGAEQMFIENMRSNKYSQFNIWPQDFLNDFFEYKWQPVGSQINVARECMAVEQKIALGGMVQQPQNFMFHNEPILVHFLGHPKPFHDEYWDERSDRWRIQNTHLEIDFAYRNLLNEVILQSSM